MIHVYNNSYIDFDHRLIRSDIFFAQEILSELARSISLDQSLSIPLNISRSKGPQPSVFCWATW